MISHEVFSEGGEVFLQKVATCPLTLLGQKLAVHQLKLILLRQQPGETHQNHQVNQNQLGDLIIKTLSEHF